MIQEGHHCESLRAPGCSFTQTPDGNGRLELFEDIHPDAIETEPNRPHEIGMNRVAFSVDDLDEALKVAARHGCHPLRGVATYHDVYELTYVRGPSGILVMLAEELKTSDRAPAPRAGPPPSRCPIRQPGSGWRRP